MIKDMTEDEIFGILMDKDKEVDFRKQWFEEFMQQPTTFYDEQKSKQVDITNSILAAEN